MNASESRPHPNRVWLYTLIGLMQFFWTANFLIGKIALREFPPLLASGLRVWIAAVCILPFYWRNVHGKKHWTRRDLPLLVFLGFLSVAVNQLCFLVGLSKTSAAHSSIMISMTPIWVVLLASMRGLEHISARRLIGMVTAFAGVAVLSLERHAPSASGPTLSGDLITLLAASAFALYTILGKEVNHRYGTLTVNTFMFVSGAVFLLPVLFWQAPGFAFSQVSLRAWLALIYMGVFPSFVCYMIFYYALGYVKASRLSMLAYVQPVAATAMGVLLLGERLTVPLIAGGAVIFTGVYLAERA